MLKMDDEIFDTIMDPIIRDCPNFRETDCNTCGVECILKHCKRYGDELNVLRQAFVIELSRRTIAMYKATRFNDLKTDEFKRILGNHRHFNYNAKGELVAIY